MTTANGREPLTCPICQHTMSSGRTRDLDDAAAIGCPRCNLKSTLGEWRAFAFGGPGPDDFTEYELGIDTPQKGERVGSENTSKRSKLIRLAGVAMLLVGCVIGLANANRYGARSDGWPELAMYGLVGLGLLTYGAGQALAWWQSGLDDLTVEDDALAPNPARAIGAPPSVPATPSPSAEIGTAATSSSPFHHKLECPNGHRFEAKTAQAGKQIACPDCGRLVLFPKPGVAASLVTLAVSLAICGGCFTMFSEQSRPTTSIESSNTNEWYSGGTLHTKTVAEWKSATYQDRLATCADFVITMGKYDELPSDLRRRARDLEACISTATYESSVEYKRVNEIAATCAVRLGN